MKKEMREVKVKKKKMLEEEKQDRWKNPKIFGKKKNK